MSGLFRFWQKDEPVEVINTSAFVPTAIPHARILPPVAFVRERLEAQQQKNQEVIGNLETEIARLSEELRQRRVVGAALEQAVATLCSDPAAKQEIIPPKPSDPQLWSDILHAAEKRNGEQV